MAYLLDSDVLIWQLRGHAPTVGLLRELAQVEHEKGGSLSPLGCSVVSVFEVRSGMRAQEEQATEQLLTTLERYAVDEAIARKAADDHRSFTRHGLTLHIADLLIAATAITWDLTLVTYNQSHFPMEELRLYRPMPTF